MSIITFVKAISYLFNEKRGEFVLEKGLEKY